MISETQCRICDLQCSPRFHILVRRSRHDKCNIIPYVILGFLPQIIPSFIEDKGDGLKSAYLYADYACTHRILRLCVGILVYIVTKFSRMCVYVGTYIHTDE